MEWKGRLSLPFFTEEERNKKGHAKAQPQYLTTTIFSSLTFPA
jgi:hypothetical protein